MVGKIKEERGSFTLEATLVFPILFLILFALFFLGIWMFQEAVLYHKASMTAERVTFAWSNRQRDLKTGALSVKELRQFEQNSDGLYRRLGLPGQQTVRFDSEQNGSSSRLASFLQQHPSAYQGDATFENKLLQKSVTIHLEDAMNLPSLYTERFILQETNKTRSMSVIVDPVEVIRTVDLIQAYTHRQDFNRKKISQRFRKKP